MKNLGEWFYRLQRLIYGRTSGQDGGIDRHASPLHATWEELQLGLKANNTKNHQKIQLYGSSITKDLKDTHSSRWVGWAELWRQVGRWCDTEKWRQQQQWNRLEGQRGSEQSQLQVWPHSPGFQHWEDRSPLHLAVKTSGGWGSRRKCRIFTA